MLRPRVWPLAAVLLAACDTSSEAAIELTERVHVAEVESTDVVLGAIVEDEELTVYVCGGPTTFDTHTRWFRGGFGDGGDPNAFSIGVDGFVLEGVRTAEGLEGELVEPEGEGHPFRTTPTTDEDAPGLYTADADGCTTGVVVLPGVRAQGTYCNDQGVFTQVIILQPGDLTSAGFQVQVERPDGPLMLMVEPV